jgi:hypothetical protein
LAITAWFYLGLKCGAQKGAGKKLKKARQNYEQADSWDKKIVYAVFNSVFLLKIGFWGFLTTCAGGLLSLVATICGFNPFPYYLELWDRFLQLIGLIEESTEQAPPPDAEVSVTGG